MQKMQEIFDQIQELKKSRKEIGKEYRDALTQASGYEELKEEIKKLREKKKLLEEGVQSEMGSRYEDFERFKHEIISLEEMLTDIAMNNLMEGKSINLKDQYDVEYEPSYKITFKKIG
jgi:predicted nuclease with TOPRIM domain